MKALSRVVIFLSVCLLFGASRSDGISPGALAPEAGGVVLQGPPGLKLSQLRGKVVILDFWATWCGPCIQTLPELSALHDELLREGYADRVAMLGVSIDSDLELPRRFLKSRPVTYPILADVLGIASQTYGLWRLPATLIIRPDGTIHFIYWGSHQGFSREIKEKVLALLDKK